MQQIRIAMLLGILLVAGLQLQAQGQKDEPVADFETQGGDTSYVMHRYILVMLYRGKKATKFSKSELESIQAGHMANINRLAREGKLLVAGPMDRDEDLRGIFILDCATVAEAEALVDTDPAIMAGRLRAEYHPWWSARGTVIK